MVKRTFPLAVILLILGTFWMAAPLHVVVARSLSLPTAAHDNTVELAGLFSDQGPLYDSVLEPTCSTSITVSVRSYHNDLTAANIVYYDTATSSSATVSMSLVSVDATGLFDLWQGTIPASCSIKYYRFELIDGSAVAWYNAAGASSSEPSTDDFYLIPGYTVPSWARSGIMYEIMPDRFYDGDTSNDVTTGAYSYQGDSTIQAAWGSSPDVGDGNQNNLVFYGGDLQGIDQKLSYIKNTLGANIVYLMPIFTAPSNHKYDTQNYFQVDPHLGGDSAFSQLVSDVHSSANGPASYIVLDGVFDHTGVWNTWFNQGNVNANDDGAEQSQSSPYYSYYDFQNWPTTYTTFLGYSTLPKLDYGSSGSAVRNSIYNTTDSVAQSWIRNYGIDGWRLDAATYADAAGNNGSDATNHQIWKEFRSAVTGADANAFIFGEDFANAAAWVNDGAEWDAATNYAGFTDPVSEWITGEDYNGNAVSLTPAQFDAALQSSRATYPTDVQQAMPNFLSGQDITRFAQRAGGNTGDISEAAIFQMTYEGLPTLFYGDEYGMQGGADPDNRRTFDWSQATTSNSLVALYQKLISIRKRYSALTDGSFMTLLADNTNNVYSYGRLDKNNRLAVVINNNSSSETITIPVYEMSTVDGSTLTDLLSGLSYQVSGGNITLTLAGHTGAVLLDRGNTSTACTTGSVSGSPCPLMAGEPETITYDGTLAASATSVTMHWGYNSWNGITDTTMTKQSNGTWQATITVPIGATTLNMAFYNQSGTWDNNSSSNYNLTMSAVASTGALVEGNSATIIYDGTLAASATSITLHWGYNNWNGSIDTAMTKQSNGIWQATITVPIGATVLNMAFYNQSSTWDNNSGNNYNLTVS